MSWSEKARKALKVLEEEGIAFVLEPNAVVVQTGRIEMRADGDGHAVSANRVKITLNGNEIQNMLSFAQVTAAVGDVIRFELKFGGLA